MTKISTKQLQEMIKEIIAEQISVTEEVDEGWLTAAPVIQPETLKMAHKAYMQVYQASEGFKKVGETMKDKEIMGVSKMLSDFIRGSLTALIKKKKLMPPGSTGE